MNVTHMLAQFVNTSEWVGGSSLAAWHITRELSAKVTLHMTLHLKVAIEQRRRRAASNATFEDLRGLAAWRDRVNR